MAPNFFENCEPQAEYTFNPLEKIIDENITVKAVTEENFHELIDPENVLSEDFLNFINYDQELEIDLNRFPNNEELATIFDDFEVDFEVDALHQSSIENFDENLFDDILEEEKPSIVINGLDEFLQVPAVISFEVPARDQINIPMTVIDHQNYADFESYAQPSWSVSFPLSTNNFVSIPVAQASPSNSSGALKKRGRKPNHWENPIFTKKYVEEAVDQKDEQKRRNNVSSGQYRKRKSEIMEQMEKEIVAEKMKKATLKIKSRKLKKQIAKLRKAVSLYNRLA